jgi:hypothetical protein
MDVGDPEMLKAVIGLGYDIDHRADITKAIRYPLRLMKMCQAVSRATGGNDSKLILYMANFPGFTALTCSAFFNNTKQLQICLEAGADVSTTNDYNRTALMFAAMNGNEEMVQLLLEAECPLGVADTWGRTAADWARICGYSRIAEKLRSLGDVSEKKKRVSDSLGIADKLCSLGNISAQSRVSSILHSVFCCVATMCTSDLAHQTRRTPNRAPPSRSSGSCLQGISDLVMR